MVYPADDTRIRVTLLRRQLRAVVEHARALVEEARRLREARKAAQPRARGAPEHVAPVLRRPGKVGESQPVRSDEMMRETKPDS